MALSANQKKNLRYVFFSITVLCIVVVVSIIINSASKQGYDAQRAANLREVQSAIEAFYNDNGTYPAANGNYDMTSNDNGDYAYASECQVGGGVSADNLITGLISGGYIPSIPTDPDQNVAANTCCYEYMVSSDGRNYKYMFLGCPTSASWNASGELADPAGEYHHDHAWSVYSGAGTLF